MKLQRFIFLSLRWRSKSNNVDDSARVYLYAHREIVLNNTLPLLNSYSLLVLLCMLQLTLCLTIAMAINLILRCCQLLLFLSICIWIETKRPKSTILRMRLEFDNHSTLVFTQQRRTSAPFLSSLCWFVWNAHESVKELLNSAHLEGGNVLRMGDNCCYIASSRVILAIMMHLF